MPNPFPGMNPYLESPELWRSVHNRLIVAIADLLTPQLLPKYLVDIEQRIYQLSGEDALVIGIPDVTIQRSLAPTTETTSNVAVAAPPTQSLKVRIPWPVEVKESYLQVIETETKKVVTVIEVLSPTNKRPGKGREMYEAKREKVFGSRTHLVEIDLLRSYQPMLVFDNDIEASYRILVSRANQRPLADLYLFNLPDMIPAFPLPLRAGDEEPIVDLQALLNGVYDRAAYDFRIDYTAAPVPALSESDAVWADALLGERGQVDSSQV
ncbi:hypothetical protein Osc7112_5835 [Oscillatoria nigro-viridis PCC 7112]|uniref:DUF4058 domain-containing protein n=1 Tax=Phormidium nigroviride PCC 7112 TaxID=179408 RepID=K9VPQ6_9CYAN|nr:DUF4058 family protein [Oscillatoria nigro-viridis]AFZ10043.1 hypothetical protein Osc7112_5835 [Oscillatoria nigro-viridis PCC 7112]